MRFTDAQGNNITVDTGKNLFKNGKCINPTTNSLLNDTTSVADYTEKFLGQEGVEPLSLVVGHVPNFEYGYGDNKVIVETGQKEW
ncbi:hypothetical protein PANI_CDS0023 [Maribacter phage Panino]